MNVEVLSDSESVAKRAATIIADDAWQAVVDRGALVMALSCGQTPSKMLRALTDMTVPWQAVRIFEVDEREAPAGHAGTHILESLKGAPIRSEQICAMPVESPELETASDGHASLLRKLTGAPPVIGLVHLGLGPDGHTAAVVPGDPALEVDQADVALIGLCQGRRRMTATYPILNRARRVLWVVTGADKAPIVDRLLAVERGIPAGRIRNKRALLLSDRVAAPFIARQNEGVGSCS